MFTIPPYLDRRRAGDMVPEAILRRYLPAHLWEPVELPLGHLKAAWFRTARACLRRVIWLVLRPRRGKVGPLDLDEVDAVYTREAATYDQKHRWTTHGMDTAWRRAAAWALVPLALERRCPLRVLDLCTGTGLTVNEMLWLFREWGETGEVVGLDYNAAMLSRARSRRFDQRGFRASFVRGNALDLVADECPNPASEFARFRPGSFDAISQVFGIGGIGKPLAVFRGVLRLLRDGGRYVLIDAHRPLLDQPGEWPFLFRLWRMPWFEAFLYETTTIPLVLNRLWGWRDPTLDFYLVPLVTWQDNTGVPWGFRVLQFEVGAERWWLNLPLIPVAKLVVEKMRLRGEEAQERSAVLCAVERATVRRPREVF